MQVSVVRQRINVESLTLTEIAVCFVPKQPPINPGKHQIVVTEPFVADRIKIRLIRFPRKTDSLCIKAEIYGCEVPRGMKILVIFFIPINRYAFVTLT